MPTIFTQAATDASVQVSHLNICTKLGTRQQSLPVLLLLIFAYCDSLGLIGDPQLLQHDGGLQKASCHPSCHPQHSASASM